jgi:peptide/nickel transport system ATP-binding protein
MAGLLTIDRLGVGLRVPPFTPLVRDVSLGIGEGEVRGLVGMSGAGKTMVGKAILGILPRSAAIVRGRIIFAGEDLAAASADRRRELMGRSIALIPQDPFTSLNPTRRIEGQMTDVLRLRLGLSRHAARLRALELLEAVRIRDPAAVLRRFPHELSGGMRQRILIANAFALEPRLIVADEPTTALDVTIQKRILRLIRDLQTQHRTALLFISHDLGVVAKICDTVSVIEAGMIVEQAPAHDIMVRPRHPFTRALFAAMPRYDRPDLTLAPVPPGIRAAIAADAEASDRAMDRGGSP